MSSYPQPRYLGENHNISCEIVNLLGDSYTVSSATVTIYDAAGDEVLSEAATIGTGELTYQLDVDAETFSAGTYRVCWEWTTSDGQVWRSGPFLLRVLACV